MDTDSGGTGTAPAPAPHGRASSRASSALAALSVVAVLLYLLWRFIWQCRQHGTRSNSTGGTVPPPTSSARQPSPSCPSTRDATAAYYGAGEEAARRTPRTTTMTSPVSVLVRVAAAPFGAEKVDDCAVCLAELGDGDGEDATTRLVPGCGHGFHAECIEAWFRVNSTCPLCRAAVAVAAAAAGQGAREAPQYDSSV